MKPVNLLNSETATNLKYEIISARTAMLIDPVTQGIQIPVQSRLQRVHWAIRDRSLMHVIEMVKREAYVQ